MNDNSTLPIPPLDTAFTLQNNGTAQYKGIIDLVAREDYYLFQKSIIPILFILCGLGTWTNAISIRTFYRLGLEDSVTIVFFLVAVSDFLYLLGSLIGTPFMLASVMERDGLWMKYLPGIMTILIYTPLRAFPEITYLSTSFLALQRCLCVVKPLHFKGMFTRSRTAFIMSCIWLFPLVFTVVICVYTGDLKMTFHPALNSTIYFLKSRPGRLLVDDIAQTTFFIVISTTNQVVVTVCVFVMAYALNKSLRFRQTMSTSGQLGDTQQIPNSSQQEEKTKKSDKHVANTKEKQAIIQVSLVCSIFLICNFFRLVFAFFGVTIPEFTVYGDYHNTYFMCFNLLAILEYINSAANFFIYYRYNSKFRGLCFRTKDKT